MKSRWTVLGPGTDVNTPVVPCDDAAIERVAAVLDDGRVYPGDESSPTWAELLVLAEAALRAAGEMS